MEKSKKSTAIINVTVKCVWWDATKILHVNLIEKPSPSSSSDAKEVSTKGNDDEDTRKYSMCSLLLQLGKLFHIQPPYAPSPQLSSIFNRILECWSLQRLNNDIDAHNNSNKRIQELSEINNGDQFLFSFGDYFRKIDSSNNTTTKTAVEEEEKEVDVFNLLPKKYKLVTVMVQQDVDGGSGSSRQGQKNNNKMVELIDILSSSDEDEVEDVTDMYLKKSRTSLEIIAVEDASSSDDDGYFVDDDRSSDWEQDEYGNLRRKPSYFEKKFKGSNNEVQRNGRRGLCSSSSSKNNINNDCDASESKKMSSMHSDDASSLEDFLDDICWGDDLEDCDVESSDEEEDENDNDSSIEDVTDEMLTKKREEQQKLIDEAEMLESDTSEDEKHHTKKRKKKNNFGGTTKRKKKVHAVPPIEVVIEDQDVPCCPGGNPLEDRETKKNNNREKEEGNTTGDNQVDLSIKQRIIKLLNTGLHCDSNEHEAKNAMKLARRLLDRYNLDQAVLLKERGDGSLNDFSTTNDKGDGPLHGGIVTVNILNRRKTVPLSSMPRWLENLIAPVTANFRVNAFMSFSKGKGFLNVGKCSVSFFGIKTNAQLAAYAFKTASERIAMMTASHEPPGTLGLEAKRKQASRTRTARLSYALGIVAGLLKDVKRGLREEEEKREKDLKRARRAAKKGEAYHEDVDCIDEHDDEQEQQQQQNMSVAEKLHQLEAENEARLALIDCNKKIAEDILTVRGTSCCSENHHFNFSLFMTFSVS